MSSGAGEERSQRQSQLRMINLVLSAVEDTMSSMQRLLSHVRGEVEDLLRDDTGSPDDDEMDALRREIEQLRGALMTRPVIEQAKGVLMQRHRISESESFALLNEESQQRRTKLREVATEITNGAVLGRRSVAPAPGTVIDGAIADGPVVPKVDLDAHVPTPRRPRSARLPAAAGSPG